MKQRKTSKERFGEFILKFRVVRTSVFEMGIKVFGALGFLYSILAIHLITNHKVLSYSEIRVIQYSFSVFGLWLKLLIFAYVLGWIFYFIYFNKKNWEKSKNVNKYSIFKNVK